MTQQIKEFHSSTGDLLTFEDEFSRSVWACIEGNHDDLWYLSEQGWWGAETTPSADRVLMVYNWKADTYVLVVECLYNAHVRCVEMSFHKALKDRLWGWSVMQFHKNDLEPFLCEGGNEWRHM